MRKKICFVSSSGGHWEELMCLKTISERNDSFFVTEEGGQAQDSDITDIYTLPQINRNKERPNVVITTGALIAFPFCVFVKLRGGKVIYIESFARVYNSSLTGKIIYKFADLFLVQWESMLEVYPKAKYVGGIF